MMMSQQQPKNPASQPLANSGHGNNDTDNGDECLSFAIREIRLSLKREQRCDRASYSQRKRHELEELHADRHRINPDNQIFASVEADEIENENTPVAANANECGNNDADYDGDECLVFATRELRSSVKRERRCDCASYSRRRRCDMEALRADRRHIDPDNRDVTSVVEADENENENAPVASNGNDSTEQQGQLRVLDEPLVAQEDSALQLSNKPQGSSFRHQTRRGTLEATSDVISKLYSYIAATAA